MKLTSIQLDTIEHALNTTLSAAKLLQDIRDAGRADSGDLGFVTEDLQKALDTVTPVLDRVMEDEDDAEDNRGSSRRS